MKKFYIISFASLATLSFCRSPNFEEPQCNDYEASKNAYKIYCSSVDFRLGSPEYIDLCENYRIIMLSRYLYNQGNRVGIRADAEDLVTEFFDFSIQAQELSQQLYKDMQNEVFFFCLNYPAQIHAYANLVLKFFESSKSIQQHIPLSKEVQNKILYLDTIFDEINALCKEFSESEVEKLSVSYIF